MNLSKLGRMCCCVASLSISLATPSTADEGRGVNGGQLVDRGAIHVEFIGGQDYSLLIFAISDKSQKPIPVDGEIAFAIAELNGEATQIPLTSSGSSFLSSSEGSKLKKGDEVWFIARMSNGETLKAKFISR